LTTYLNRHKLPSQPVAVPHITLHLQPPMSQDNIPIYTIDDPIMDQFFDDMMPIDLPTPSSSSFPHPLGESSPQQPQTYPAGGVVADQPMPTIEHDMSQNTHGESPLRPSRSMTIDENYEDESGDDAREGSLLSNVYTDFDTLYKELSQLTSSQSSASPEGEVGDLELNLPQGSSAMSYTTVPRVTPHPTWTLPRQSIPNRNSNACLPGTRGYSHGLGYPSAQYAPPHNSSMLGFGHPSAQAMMPDPRSYGGQAFSTNVQHGGSAGYGYGLQHAPWSRNMANNQQYQMPFAAQPCYEPTANAYMGPAMQNPFPQHKYALPSQSYQPVPQQKQSYALPKVFRGPTIAPIPANQLPASPAASDTQSQPQGLYFKNLAQAKHALATRVMSANTTWEPDTTDPTIPRNDTEQAKYVLQVLSAMKDTRVAQDSTRHWPRGPADAKQPYYHPSHVEKVCWVLISKAVALHTQGPRTLATYDPSALRNARIEQRLTFGARIDAMCALLRFSKSRCDRLMKGETFEIVVGAPQHLLNQSRMNKDQNQIKQGRLKKGIEAEKLKAGSETCEPARKRALESDDSEAETAASAGRKRARR
jgi:hypothetical protein